ncbi:hypothetical protein TTHT_1575 [Thermotomaculum hydrothermale]|uniref:Uncharacterized protein n=1 Tax=Thermotomaculum hydrothermale TaxID=981385 RepID=A0A7R6PMZ7_9BACT|nr:hypothetical protein [Thermotomaculum hydrothermale]BBB33067.1 hypothetical protein TTHT_1575 [Thermotomaculum hydrothermale]
MDLSLVIIIILVILLSYISAFFETKLYDKSTSAEEEEKKAIELVKLIAEIFKRLNDEDREFINKYREDFSNKYFDAKNKTVHTSANSKKIYYLFVSLRLEGVLIFLINYAKFKRNLFLLDGINIPDEYYSLATEWENKCLTYFSTNI